MKAIEALLLILENPHAKKGYQDFAKYLKFAGKIKESEAFEYLMDKKFNAHDPNNHQEQPKNN
jgi:hypothetical protein